MLHPALARALATAQVEDLHRVSERGRPIAHVARELGVHRETLRLWVRQAEADGGRRRNRLTTAERERLKALERENRELRRATGC
jgi:transposase